jgi:hypothetical protein
MNDRATTDRLHVFGRVSALIPLKQEEIAISIIASLAKTFPNLKADITGEGIERKKMEALAEKFQLQETICSAAGLTGEK